MTEEMAEVLLDEREAAVPRGKGAGKGGNRLAAPAAVTRDDKDYLLGMFEVLSMSVEANLHRGPAPYEGKGRKMRYTPEQMWHNIKMYVKATVERGQPLTLSMMCLFNGLHRDDFSPSRVKEMPEQYHFLFDCAQFVEAYNEYAAHKKQNPAGPIFILKNFGWKDKFEIEASSTAGALSEAERAEAQKRIAEFSEGKVLTKPV